MGNQERAAAIVVVIIMIELEEEALVGNLFVGALTLPLMYT